MNKLLKGAIATAAAALLLTGGAGSLAYWNAQTTVDGGTITAGNLTLANSGSAAWTDANGATVDLSTFKVVPGDVLTLTQNVTVTATGNNLVGTLSVDSGSITGTLSTFLTKNATISVTGSPAGVNCAAGTTCTITAGSTGVSNQALTVKIVITFPKSLTVAGAENGAMLQTASLSNLTIKLEQNH